MPSDRHRSALGAGRTGRSELGVVSEVVGIIANPSGEGARVNVQLSDIKVSLKNVAQGRYYYETTMKVMDSNGAPIWEGKIYTEWNAFFGVGRVYFERPPIIDRPQQVGLEPVP